MSWLCSPSNVVPLTHPTIVQEFRRIDPKTGQIFTQTVTDHRENTAQYEGWRRTKIESVDLKGLNDSLKEKKSHFVDPEFPHTNAMLSQESIPEQIEWKRVRDIFEYAVYSKEQTLKTLEKVKLNRK